MLLFQLAGADLRVYFLYLHYILLYFLEVGVFELSVLIKIRSLLTISKYKRRNFF